MVHNNIKTLSEITCTVIPAICFVGYTWPGKLLAHIPSRSVYMHCTAYVYSCGNVHGLHVTFVSTWNGGWLTSM